jgi:hypothetical protein
MLYSVWAITVLSPQDQFRKCPSHTHYCAYDSLAQKGTRGHATEAYYLGRNQETGGLVALLFCRSSASTLGKQGLGAVREPWVGGRLPVLHEDEVWQSVFHLHPRAAVRNPSPHAHQALSQARPSMNVADITAK